MSGLSYHPGKVAQGQPCRGFESLSLRQKPILLLKINNKINSLACNRLARCNLLPRYIYAAQISQTG
jgi:hypothetical protein